MTHYGIIEDYAYNATHKRKRLTLWSGPFASVREGEAYSLPKGDGYMVTLEYGDKIRVECPVERTDANYREQDKAFNVALNRHRLEYLRSRIEAESISTYELIELQGMVEYIEPGDVQLLEWAGVEEFPEDEEQEIWETVEIEDMVDYSREMRYRNTYRPNGKRVIRK